MPIFEIENKRVKRVRATEFALEKELQKLFEKNLETFFNCRFVATEYSTGNIHSGRIDTLALSEDLNPVIIEYKKVASSELINQSLFYLHWLQDHKGDFQIIAEKVLNEKIEVDWSEIRVICIAPNYKKYDLHAVQMMGASIELWQYKLYENSIISLENVFQKSNSGNSRETQSLNEKNPVMVEAGKKAAETRKNATYTIEEHERKIKSPRLKELFNEIREFIVSLDNAIEETPKKYYIAYKTSQNFVCLETYNRKINLYLKLNISTIEKLPEQIRDVSKVGHQGTGDTEVKISRDEDFEIVKELIVKSLENIGG